MLRIAISAELTDVGMIDQVRIAPIVAMPIEDGPFVDPPGRDYMKTAPKQVDWVTHEFAEACLASGVKHRVVREVGERAHS